MNQCLQYDKFHYKSASWHSPSFLQIKTKQRPSEKTDGIHQFFRRPKTYFKNYPADIIPAANITFTDLESNIIGRIDRFAVLTHLKMKLGTAGIGIAHFGNGLATFHSLTFVNQKTLVMTVCT